MSCASGPAKPAAAFGRMVLVGLTRLVLAVALLGAAVGPISAAHADDTKPGAQPQIGDDAKDVSDPGNDQVISSINDCYSTIKGRDAYNDTATPAPKFTDRELKEIEACLFAFSKLAGKCESGVCNKEQYCRYGKLLYNFTMRITSELGENNRRYMERAQQRARRPDDPTDRISRANEYLYSHPHLLERPANAQDLAALREAGMEDFVFDLDALRIEAFSNRLGGLAEKAAADLSGCTFECGGLLNFASPYAFVALPEKKVLDEAVAGLLGINTPDGKKVCPLDDSFVAGAIPFPGEAVGGLTAGDCTGGGTACSDPLTTTPPSQLPPCENYAAEVKKMEAGIRIVEQQLRDYPAIAAQIKEQIKESSGPVAALAGLADIDADKAGINVDKASINPDADVDKIIEDALGSEKQLREDIEEAKSILAAYKAKCGPKDGSSQGAPADAALPQFFNVPLIVGSDSGNHCEYRTGGPKTVIATVTVVPEPQPASTPGSPGQPCPSSDATCSPPPGEPAAGPATKPPVSTESPDPCEELIRLYREVEMASAIANDAKTSADKRIAARQRAATMFERIRQLEPLCRGKTGKPIATGPIPEGLPPCEELQRVYAAIEKESADAGDRNFSDADRAAANQRAAQLTERARKLEPLCRQSRTNRPTREAPPTQVSTTPTGGSTSKPPVPAPVPAGGESQPCEKLAALIEQRRKLDRDFEAHKGDILYTKEINQEQLRVDAEIKQLAAKCPSNKDLPLPVKPLVPESKSPLKVTVFFKATSAALERGAKAQDEFAGQRAKLFTPDVADRSLPPKKDPPDGGFDQEDPIEYSDAEKLAKQDGAAKDPVVFTFDSTGFDVLKIDPSDLVIDGLAITPPKHDDKPFVYMIDFEIDVTKQDSRNVFLNPGDGIGKAKDLAKAITDQFGPGVIKNTSAQDIGGTPVVTVDFVADKVSQVEDFIRSYAGARGIEINICRTKEPLTPRPDGHYVPAPANHELRGAALGLSALGLGEAP